MREILFRGKRVDNGEWVEGDLFHHSDGKTEIFVPKEVLFAWKYKYINYCPVCGAKMDLPDK